MPGFPVSDQPQGTSAPDCRQLCDPQASAGEGLAGAPATLSCQLHSHLRLPSAIRWRSGSTASPNGPSSGELSAAGGNWSRRPISSSNDDRSDQPFLSGVTADSIFAKTQRPCALPHISVRRQGDFYLGGHSVSDPHLDRLSGREKTTPGSRWNKPPCGSANRRAPTSHTLHKTDARCFFWLPFLACSKAASCTFGCVVLFC